MLEGFEFIEAFFETVIGFTVLIFIVSSISALFGVLTGLGGGILLVPILSFFDIDLRHAMGVSLISIVSLSLMTATTKTSQLLTNIKIALFLETGAVIGAVIGALILPLLSIKFIAIFFGCILLFAVLSNRRKAHAGEDADFSGLKNKKTPVRQKDHFIKDLRHYSPKKLSFSWFFMGLSGVISGILGIGSGALKVFAMDRILGLPYKVSTASSNFMVGITAAASIGIYYFHHYFNYGLMFPVIVGVYCGTLMGTELLVLIKTPILRRVFNVVVLVLALQMFYKGLNA